MYKGYLSDAWYHEFESRSVMVEEDNGKDSDRIRRLYNHLGRTPTLLTSLLRKSFKDKNILLLRCSNLIGSWRMLETWTIHLGALHIYNKERIYGKLEPFNVVCNSDGIVKLFGATGYWWTPQNEPQELLDLGSLLSKCICKNTPHMSAYKQENPVAYDVINKLLTKSMTLPRLIRHKYMWDSETTMKLLYDVTMCLDDHRPRSDGSNLEAEFLKKNNEDKVFKNKKNNIHRKYMELGKRPWAKSSTESESEYETF
ncbi:hypothetical protein Tco_0743732 [Tanacetum coccineum]